MPKTRHRISGVIENNTPQHIIDHPVLGKYLELVDDDAKALVPELVPADTEKAKDIASLSKAKVKVETETDKDS